MNRKWFGIFGLCTAAALLLGLSNCARNSHLVSIAVVPPGATFEAVGAEIQFTALGTYIHPPATKNITDQVSWSLDSQNLATVTNTGYVTSTSICGSGNLYASMQDGNNDVIGSAFLTGAGVGTSACNEALLTVNILSGSGTVTSSPSGISCPTACATTFLLDSTVSLSATPSGGAISTTWGGCTPSGNSCSLSMTGNETVTVTFE